MMTPTTDNVIKALIPFIEDNLKIPVYRGQENRVAMPKGGFCIINPLFKSRLSMAEDTYTDTEELKAQHILTRIEYTLQVDFYGKNSGDTSQGFCNLFNDQWGWDIFPKGIKPLYSTDPRLTPLTAAEKQYIQRWMCEAHIQYNPEITVPMDFIHGVEVKTREFY